jgi:hypothetical protein
MNTINTYKPPPKISQGSKGSFLDWITQYESFVIFGGFIAVILFTIILAGIFQASDPYRPNILYNAFGAFLMGGTFIYIIFSVMGKQINILGKQIDVGMIIYISIILFVMFVFGN